MKIVGTPAQPPEITDTQTCPGCGSRLPALEGPVHAYATSSPACWHAYGLVLAREYSDPALMPTRRLSVDTWAVQHPGDGSRRAIQSVGLHLARLMVQLEFGLEGEAANGQMLRFAARKHGLPALPPRTHYRLTVADVVDAATPADHITAIRAWAHATWQDWADQDGFIKGFVEGGR